MCKKLHNLCYVIIKCLGRNVVKFVLPVVYRTGQCTLPLHDSTWLSSSILRGSIHLCSNANPRSKANPEHNMETVL